MSVVVAATIVAPVSVRTTWTEVPVTAAPFAGWTIATTAGDDGRGPLAVGSAEAPRVAFVVGALLPQPARTTAASTAAAGSDRGIIGTSWLHGEREMDVDRSPGRRVRADDVDHKRAGIER